MTLLVATTIGVVFGVGVYLVLDPDLVRNAAGILVISHAINVLLMASGHFRGSTPVLPAPFEAQFSDPLAQALTLTALVITFALTAIVLALAYRLYDAHDTLDRRHLASSEYERLRSPSPDSPADETDPEEES